MERVFMVINRLNPEGGGGINRAILNRSKNLSDKGYRISIVTFGNFDVDEVKRKLNLSNRLDKRVELLNIHDYYRKTNKSKTISRAARKHYERSTFLHEHGYNVKVDRSKRSAKYFKEGVYIKSKNWDEHGLIRHIDYFNEYGEKVQREEFHDTGFVSQITNYNPYYDTAVYTRFFTTDGFCYLTSWYNPETEKVSKNLLFNRKSQKVKSFKGNKEFHSYWLNKLVSEHSDKPFIICDGIGSAPKVMNMKENIAYKIYVMHSNHFSKPYTVGSKTKIKHKKVLDNLKALDAVVTLTEKQKMHIIDEYNDYDNIHVIPHNIQKGLSKKVKKENKTITMVARLHPEKRISHAIEAFSKVIQTIPDAKLEIYGAGDYESKLTAKIKQLNLQQNVFLCGYTNKTNLIYKKSLCTLLTSKFEGFSLTILESMTNGTPVISYDVNYGPSDIIVNGVNGYLIKPNKTILADKIINLLKHPKLANEMGKNAKRYVFSNFNEKTIVNKWIDLFETLKRNDNRPS